MRKARARPVTLSIKRHIGLGGLLALCVYLIHSWSYLFLNDDAYISFRYALHWIDYGEVTYNLGEYVEGYTNFLWVALLAACYWLGASIPDASLWLSVGIGLGMILLLLAECGTESAWTENREPLPKSREVIEKYTSVNLSRRGLIIAWFLALSPSFACWSTGGLEVMLFTFLLSLGLILSARSWGAHSRSSKRQLCLGVGAGGTLALASMTRPEGVLIFGIVGLYRLMILARQRSWFSLADWGGGICFCGLYLPYFAWRYHYYGYLFPNTYYAKVGASGFWTPGLRYVGEFLLYHPWIFAPMGLVLIKGKTWLNALGALTEKELHLTRLAIFCGSAMCIHVARVGGDFMALHRFLVPLLPMCALISSRFIVAALDELTPIKSKSLSLALVLMMGLGAGFVYQDANRIGSRGGVDSIGWLRQFSEQCALTGRYIDQVAPKEAKLATTAAGALPFYAKRYTLDLLGLNDEWIAHHVPARGQRPGHTKSAPFKYPIDKKIDYLIYHPSFTRSKPRASEQMARALKPYGYRWESHLISGLEPPWWSVWTLHPSSK